MESEVRYSITANLTPGTPGSGAYKTHRTIESLAGSRGLPIEDCDIERFVEVRVEASDFKGHSKKAVGALLRDLANNQNPHVKAAVAKQEQGRVLLDAHRLRSLSSRLVLKEVTIPGVGPKLARSIAEETGLLIATAEADLADNAIG